MAGKGSGKSRLSGRRGPAEDRSAKRHKAYSIKQFLQPVPPPPQQPSLLQDSGLRDSSEEPDDQLPGQTPAMGLVAAAAAAAAGPQFTVPTAAGVKLQTGLLRSLQHRFLSQQALETPAWPNGGSSQQQQHQGAEPGVASAGDTSQQQLGASGEEEEEEERDGEEDDGFQIFSQLAYEPTFLSQRPAELGCDVPASQATAARAAAGLDTSQQASQTQALPFSQHETQPAAIARERGCTASEGAAGGAQEDDGDGDDGLDWPSSQLLSQHQQQDDALRRASGVSAASHRTTPALHSSERVQCDGAGASGHKVFPMFQRRDNMKRVYIVRHGESSYNAAMHARGSSWADPHIFDAQLTERGKQQAKALRQQLAALDLPPDTLWLTSPLQRAMQTLLLACPTAHLLGCNGSGSGERGGAGGGSAENSSAVPNGGSEQPPKVVVLQSITEKVFTSGDIGHPSSELRKHFPQLDSQLATLPELWWHCPEGKPNCAVQKLFGSHETKEQVLSRVGAFRRWLQGRPESVVVAVGHSSYWRSFEEVCRGSKPSHMRNCEFRLIHF